MRTGGIGRMLQQVGGMMRGGSRGAAGTARRPAGRATRRPAAGTRGGRPAASGGGLGGIVRRFLR